MSVKLRWSRSVPERAGVWLSEAIAHTGNQVSRNYLHIREFDALSETVIDNPSHITRFRDDSSMTLPSCNAV